MQLLVTGGAGFIGSHLIEKLIAEDHNVVCLDSFNDYYDPALKRRNIQSALSSPNYALVELDILDDARLEALFNEHAFDMVIHLAARAGVRPSIQQPLLYEQVNVQGTIHLLEMCRIHGIKKFVFASSSSVYGANKKVPFAESDSVDNPVSPYAATKKAGELICYTYHKLYNISINCLRFFTVYGPRQRPDMAIHKFARLIYQGRPLPVFGSGKSRRDYTYYTDIIQGLLGAIRYCDGYHIYNLGESKTVELMTLIELLQEALGIEAILDFQPDQPGDVPITFADVSKARAELKYDPQINIEEGIRLFAKWFLENTELDRTEDVAIDAVR
ncbi:NAD-dependent epimerase/dehydratase family protein [candidate division KSB1 bacterium]|nr:GDP-mannose 4,6-dehydratase [candidate division KSB1 bacterium]RQV99901.1 MAG: NAD-dependent epimerase/dehydratase family protein [candidate division KSB1 bacterium]